MNAVIIIPARLESTRLERKLLLSETGKPLIQHTYERASECARARRVIVATDSDEIASVVRGFGGEAAITSPSHQSGSARIAEVAETLDASIIVNIQGDEPEIDPKAIDALIAFHERRDFFVSTLICPFAADARSGAGSPDDPAAVKAIVEPLDRSDEFRARHFTRRLFAFPRDESNCISDPARYWLHIGVYAYSKTSLRAFAASPPGVLETSLRLEQLRILEKGEEIGALALPTAFPGVDTREDYESFKKRVARLGV